MTWLIPHLKACLCQLDPKPVLLVEPFYGTVVGTAGLRVETHLDLLAEQVREQDTLGHGHPCVKSV